MQWDLGPQGLAVLVAMSVAFGVLAQLALRGSTIRWVWLVASTAFFLAGAFVSEVLFGWATEAELQPNIDGLSFDEVLLLYVVGIPVVLVAAYLVRRNDLHRPMWPSR